MVSCFWNLIMALATKRWTREEIARADIPHHVKRTSAGSMPFSGRVWIGQLAKITIDTGEEGATRFLYMTFAGTHTWAEAMPDQQPADGVVFDLDQTAGDIHIIGNFAG
jgi:hypothetical protein